MTSVACRNLLTSYKVLPAAKLAALTCTLVVFTRIVSVALFGGALVPFAIAAWQRYRIEISRDAETEADFAEFDGKLGSKA